MVTPACEQVVVKYLEALSGEFETTRSGSGCFLVTPFIRPDGEAIELELEQLSSGHVLIGDMGDTLGYLYVNGLTLSRSTLDNARRIARPLGVSLQRNALVVETEPESIGDAVHRLIQSVLAVTSLIRGRRANGRIRFDTEVESLIISSGVTYDGDYEITGRREKHAFRFHVNSGRNLLVQPITAATEAAARTWAERWAYRFSDVLDMGVEWRPVAVLDDRSGRVIWTPRALAPVQEYAILWAERDRLAGLLGPDN